MESSLFICLSLVLCVILASCTLPPIEEALPMPAAIGKTVLEGKWRETMNENHPVKKDKTWTFEGDKITIMDGTSTYLGTFILNDEKEPRKIDFHFEGYPVNHSLYRLSGDILTLKTLNTARWRATQLAVEKGYTLIMCERINGKPAAKPANADENIQPDASIPKLASYAPPQLQIPPSKGEITNLAVLDLKSIGCDESIGPAISDTVRETLLNSGHYHVMNRASMEEILREQDFQQSGRCDDTQCIVKVGKILAVRKMVVGNVVGLGKLFKISLELVDVESGQIEKISSESCTCPKEQLLLVADTAGKKLLVK